MNRPHAVSALTDEALRTLLDLAIERIYRAGIGDGDVSWNEALAAIARVHAAGGAILQTPALLPEEGGLWAFHDGTRAHAGGLHAVSSDTSSARAQHVYSQFLSDGGDRNMPSTIFVLLAPPGAPPHLEHSEALEITTRHLSLALRLWFRNHVARHGAEAFAETAAVAGVLVNRAARVLWMNRRAHEWVRFGRIAVSRGQLEDLFGFGFDVNGAIRECLATQCARVELSADRASILEMRAVPTPRIHDQDNDGSGAVLIAIREHAPPGPAESALARLYHVTRSEAELATALASGLRAAEVAKKRGVSLSTVRTQVKALLSKTSCRSQGELIALVTRINPVLDLVPGSHPPRQDKRGDGFPKTGDDRAAGPAS